jgi:hypothetical protein
MNMPGFGAEATLYQPSIQYRTLAFFKRDSNLGSFQPAALACNPRALAQCIRVAWEDFQVCLRDGGSKAGCAAAERAEIADCNAEFAICTRGNICCGGGCTDINTDPGNCGGCGRLCRGGRCQNGGCVCSQPTPTNCNGTCTSLLNDPSNCGQCGRQCAPWDFCGGDGQCYPIT